MRSRHIGLLRRCAVEQAEEAPAEIVVGFWRLVGDGLGLQLLVAVERMQLALEFFRIGQLAAGLDDAILRPQCRRVGAGQLRCGRIRGVRRRAIAGRVPRRLRDLQTGHEAFKIALLLRLEVTSHLCSSASSRLVGRAANAAYRAIRRARRSVLAPAASRLSQVCRSCRWQAR